MGSMPASAPLVAAAGPCLILWSSLLPSPLGSASKSVGIFSDGEGALGLWWAQLHSSFIHSFTHQPFLSPTPARRLSLEGALNL